MEAVILFGAGATGIVFGIVVLIMKDRHLRHQLWRNNFNHQRREEA